MTAKVEIYVSGFCPYCTMAKGLLDRKGVAYETINVGAEQELWNEMISRSGRRTVPQIFIDEQSVGGYDDIAQLDREGRLDELLHR